MRFAINRACFWFSHDPLTMLIHTVAEFLGRWLQRKFLAWEKFRATSRDPRKSQVSSMAFVLQAKSGKGSELHALRPKASVDNECPFVLLRSQSCRSVEWHLYVAGLVYRFQLQHVGHPWLEVPHQHYLACTGT